MRRIIMDYPLNIFPNPRIIGAGGMEKRIAWFIILSIFILAFSAFSVGYVYSGLHTRYLTS